MFLHPIVYININSFDIETYIDKDSHYIPYCICFNIKKEFMSLYLTDKDENLIEKTIEKIFEFEFDKINFYIHNLNFDGILIISNLSKLKKYKFSAFLRKMAFYSLTIEYKNKKINFLCSYKLFPLSLKKIAKDFTELEKMPFPYFFSLYENLYYMGKIPDVKYWISENDYIIYCKKYNNFFNFKNYSIEYCLNDVKITSLFVQKIQKIINIFKIKINTIHSGPSLALKIFIKKFNNNRISFAISGFHDKLVRNAYYGGRCEVYGNPYADDFIFHYDFSGMYAQCMLENFAFGKHLVKLSNFNLKKEGFYWINYNSDLTVPILPIHRNIDNKLIFPNGKNITGCYWFEEILLFLEKGGTINKIIYGIEYEKFDKVFDKYVDFFSEIRKKGQAYSTFGKNMNNFLYGRLGLAEPEEYSFFVDESEFEHYCKWKNYNIKNICKVNNIYMVSLYMDDKVQKDFNILSKHKFKKNIAIAAAITSKARIKLYKAQEDVIKHGGRLLYSDTDSIFAAYKKNVINEMHGGVYWDGLKKDTEIKQAIFVNPKTYALKYYDNSENVKIKGFDNKNISFAEIKNHFYSKKKIEKELTILKRNKLELKMEKINKILNLNNYDKRIFKNNFNETDPIIYTSF